MADLSVRLFARWPVGVALIIQVAVFSGINFVIANFAPALFSSQQIFFLILSTGMQGLIAAGISAILPLDRWWIAFHALFPWAIIAGQAIRLPGELWLGGFIFTWLIYRNALGERVPLYLSSADACHAVSALLPEPPFRFLDLGCGTGGLIAYLAQLHPADFFAGIESAPLPWLITRLRLSGRKNCRIYWGNFWRHPLGNYDVVYCFLSPEPMERLWIKASMELPSGALFISNTFIINTAPAPDAIVQLAGEIGPLYIWRIEHSISNS